MRTLTLALLLTLPAAGIDWVQSLGGKVERNTRGAVTGVLLRGAFVSDADLDAIAALPAVEKLDLSLTRITDLGLLRLKALTSVREINLFYAELVTDEGLAAMKDWQRIERLNLRGTKVTDNTLALLAGRDSIVALDIGFAEVTDSGLQHLPRLRNLRELAFGGNKMTEVGLQVLRSLPKLTRLDISGKQRTDSGLWFVGVTDIGLDPVATLAELQDLNISGTPVSSRGVEKLTKLAKLQRLDLHGNKRVGDDVVPYLTAMTSLRWVDLKDTGVTSAGFAALRSARPMLVVGGDPKDDPTELLKTELETRDFRVVRVHYEPNQTSNMHDHPDSAAVVYVYLSDSGPMRFEHDDGRVLERPPVRLGGLRVARGGKESHKVTNLSAQATDYVRVEILDAKKGKLTSDKRFEPVTVIPADNGRRLVFENDEFRVLRLACPSRGNCVANESRALDIHLPTGVALGLREGSPARFNETNLPLELVRIELKPGDDE